MSSQRKWKLLGALVIALAILGGVAGWQQFAPKPVPPTVITVTPTATMVTGSQTVVASQRQTEWIRIGEVKPVSHYLSLLESNRTAPYAQLFWELLKLPNLVNATAVAKITYLALNATSPEAKEAFELMTRGGTPDPRDFSYSVPNYNTDLQVLYWLACQNEFKKDDTLALALAMTHGLWVTIGDEQVKDTVRKDINDLLAFFRETNDKQRLEGHGELEDYPLEAKLCLAWTGSITPAFGEYGLSKHRLSNDYTSKRVDLEAYTWNTVNATTLNRMRDLIEQNRWSSKDVNQVVAKLEDYFYFKGRRSYPGSWRSDHWIYSTEGMNEGHIEIAGKRHKNWYLFSPNHQFDLFLRNGYVTGGCADETVMIGALAKSCGIATTALWTICNDPKPSGHMYSIYYDPSDKSWKAYGEQLAWYVIEPGGLGVKYDLALLHIFKPPIQQAGYVNIFQALPNLFGGNMCVTFKGVFTLSSTRDRFSQGIPTQNMKQWLLYS